jgi:hypothetical protein
LPPTSRQNARVPRQLATIFCFPWFASSSEKDAV